VLYSTGDSLDESDVILGHKALHDQAIPFLDAVVDIFLKFPPSLLINVVVVTILVRLRVQVLSFEEACDTLSIGVLEAVP
jgi:hypothetical protein